jgi:hypothetical protein
MTRQRARHRFAEERLWVDEQRSDGHPRIVGERIAFARGNRAPSPPVPAGDASTVVALRRSPHEVRAWRLRHWRA